MTELEKKLIDYGYQKRDNYYYKSTYYSYIEIELDNNKEHIINYYVQNNKGQIKRKKVFKVAILEKKLIDLGYEYDGYDYSKIIRIKLQNLNYHLSFTLRIKVMDNVIIDYYVYSQSRCFKEDISNAYKQAFNQLQSDLKELEQCQ